MKKEEKTIGGVYPPVVALVEGRGDCDTKTALMASIPLNCNITTLYVGEGISAVTKALVPQPKIGTMQIMK